MITLVQITVEIVTQLIHEQFPQWAHLDIRPVAHSGHDNRTFHLGDEMSIRLPSAASYVPQVEKEQTWLPLLTTQLTLPISLPVAKGKPNHVYPWTWSIYRWIEGATLSPDRAHNLQELACDLGTFLMELQSIDASDGPAAGEHNFFRGGHLAVYKEEAIQAIHHNQDRFDGALLTEIWELALASTWQLDPVWVHGDIAPGNLLMQDGRLRAVIDFGMLGVGDPACDAAMAWTFFDSSSRRIFRSALRMDEHTWNRARGWALWKALITYENNKFTNPSAAEASYRVIQAIVDDYEHRNDEYTITSSI